MLSGASNPEWMPAAAGILHVLELVPPFLPRTKLSRQMRLRCSSFVRSCLSVTESPTLGHHTQRIGAPGRDAVRISSQLEPYLVVNSAEQSNNLVPVSVLARCSHFWKEQDNEGKLLNRDQLLRHRTARNPAVLNPPSEMQIAKRSVQCKDCIARIDDEMRKCHSKHVRKVFKMDLI